MARALEEGFVPARVETRDQPDLARRFRVLWTPTLVVLDPEGAPLREVVGYLPPQALLAELALVQSLHDLRAGRVADADAGLRAFRARFGGSHAAPEAMYWEGVARYRATKDKETLWAVWRELVAAYPESTWAARTTLQ